MEEKKKLDDLPILEVAKALGINVLDASASACFVHKPTGPSIFFSPEANWFECIGEGGLKGGPVELVQETTGCTREQAEGWLVKNMIKLVYRKDEPQGEGGMIRLPQGRRGEGRTMSKSRWNTRKQEREKWTRRNRGRDGK